jgi:hypothetical protein
MPDSLPTAFCHNLNAQAPPTPGDDALHGYVRGSLWLYGEGVWICTDPSIAGARWIPLAALPPPRAEEPPELHIEPVEPELEDPSNSIPDPEPVHQHQRPPEPEEDDPLLGRRR